MHLYAAHNVLRTIELLMKARAWMAFAERAAVAECIDFARDNLAEATPVVSGRAKAGWRVVWFGPLSAAVVNEVRSLPGPRSPGGRPYVEFLFSGTQAWTRTLPSGRVLSHPAVPPNMALWGALYGSAEYARVRLAAFPGRFIVEINSRFAAGASQSSRGGAYLPSTGGVGP